MHNAMTFSNQHSEETIDDKVARMQKRGECDDREETKENVAPISSDFSECCDVTREECRELHSGDTRHSDCDVDAHELKDIKVVGVHKQQMPRRCFHFVILVMRKDGSNITVYRKWKEIRAFQFAIKKSTKQDPLQAEANYYLNDLRHRASLPNISLGSSAMKRIRLIDSLNVYFQALVHYKTVHRLDDVKRFFSPTDIDLNSAQRCGGGKTYFYVTDTITNSNMNVTDCDQSSESGSDQSDCESCSGENGDGSFQALSPTLSVRSASSSSSSSDVSSVEAQDTCQISSPMHGEIYVALEDHEPLETDCDQHILSLKKGDKVEVLMKNNCGWWFARCSHGNQEEERTGYVPATYLARENKLLERKPTKSKLNIGLRKAAVRLLSSSKSSSTTDVRRHSAVPNLGFRNSSLSSSLSSSSTDIRRLSDTRLFEKNNNIRVKRSYTDSPSSLRRHVLQQQGCEHISKNSYKAKNPDELSFAENSVLKILHKNEDGWWLARYKGREGLVPGVLLQKYCDPLRRLSLSVVSLNVDA